MTNESMDQNKIAKVLGTRSFTVQVKLPHTIYLRATDKDSYYYEEIRRDKPSDWGWWNSKQDLIKDQLPKEDRNEILNLISKGQIEAVDDNNLFHPISVDWLEEEN